MEQRQEYVTPNLSRFTTIDEKDFLSGTRMLTTLNIVGSQFLLTQFLRAARRPFEEFMNCLVSTVASR